MAHLIDKDALVAEIERRVNSYLRLQNTPEMSDLQKELQNKIDCLNSFKGWLNNTLEVKEVDLGKFTEKINTFQARYKHPEITSIKGAMAFMARMFYQYPNVAREWYESLPKATMD